MYAQKMAAAIKVQGQSLRELNENVYLPFGSEYSIYLKNLNTVRASVKVEIDGQDVTQGVSLVIDPNDSFELERFIKNGNLQRGNRFKFVEKTAAVAAFRGDRVDDGLVRITYQFEKQQHIYVNSIGNHNPGFINGSHTFYGDGRLYSASASTQGAIAKGGVLRSRRITDGHPGVIASAASVAQNAVGVTAPGSVSEQEFAAVAPLTLDYTTHVIVLRLVGEHKGKQVTKASTTRTTTTCETCGHKTRSATAKFCANCGASLTLID